MNATIKALTRHQLGILLGRRRLFLVVLLAVFPVVICGFVHGVSYLKGGSPMGAKALFQGLASGYYLIATLLLNLILGLALVSDEVEGRTLPYLICRPIPRAHIVYGKYLALLAVGELALLASLVAAYLACYAPSGRGAVLHGLRGLAGALVWIALSVPAYGAAFTFLGALARKPLNVAAAFVFLWELALGCTPTALRKLTITHYLLSLSPESQPLNTLVDLLGLRSSTWVSVVSLLALTVIYVWGAGQVFAKRQYISAAE